MWRKFSIPENSQNALKRFLVPSLSQKWFNLVDFPMSTSPWKIPAALSIEAVIVAYLLSESMTFVCVRVEVFLPHLKVIIKRHRQGKR